MKKKKQRYCLVLHARVNEAVSAEQRHTRFFEGIKDLPAPWGLGDRPAPPPPDFGRGSSAAIGLTKFFGDGVKRAMLTYRYRRMLTDDGYSDDRLIIDFDPMKVDLHHLTYTVIPQYIEAFDAYRLDYYDEQFADLAYVEQAEGAKSSSSANSKVDSNPRYGVERIDVVSFFDDLLCRRAFDLPSAEVMKRLQRKAEHVQMLHGGVYLIGSTQALPFEEALSLSQMMKSALLG